MDAHEVEGVLAVAVGRVGSVAGVEVVAGVESFDSSLVPAGVDVTLVVAAAEAVEASGAGF